jgi:hypothetical protein
MSVFRLPLSMVWIGLTIRRILDVVVDYGKK